MFVTLLYIAVASSVDVVGKYHEEGVSEWVDEEGWLVDVLLRALANGNNN